MMHFFVFTSTEKVSFSSIPTFNHIDCFVNQPSYSVLFVSNCIFVCGSIYGGRYIGFILLSCAESNADAGNAKYGGTNRDEDDSWKESEAKYEYYFKMCDKKSV